MVRLPVEYQEVEYLESSGTQWIKTNISSRYSMTVESEIMFIIGRQDTYSVGFLDSTFRIGANGYYNGRSQIGYGTTYRIGAIMQSDAIYKYKTICKPGEQTVYLNDSLVNTYNMPQAEIELSGVKVGIFGRCKGETADLLSKARIYSLIISDNDESLGNFIPCYRKSDSEPGMYDTVSGTFFTNQGTGTFLVGNDVSWEAIDLLALRRMVMLSMASGVWKKITVTAPDSYTTAKQIADWLTTIKPDADALFALRDAQDTQASTNGTLLLAYLYDNVPSAYLRIYSNNLDCKGPTAWSELYNLSADSGDKYTILYQ